MITDITPLEDLIAKAKIAIIENRVVDTSLYMKQIAHLASVQSRAIDEEVRRAMRSFPFKFPVTGEA